MNLLNLLKLNLNLELNLEKFNVQIKKNFPQINCSIYQQNNVPGVKKYFRKVEEKIKN